MSDPILLAQLYQRRPDLFTEEQYDTLKGRLGEFGLDLPRLVVALTSIYYALQDSLLLVLFLVLLLSLLAMIPLIPLSQLPAILGIYLAL